MGDGFKRFAGEYAHAESGETYSVDTKGNITMSDSAKPLRFQLIAHDRISYKANRTETTQIGTLSSNGIEWENGDIWKSKPAKANDATDENADADVDERAETVSGVDASETREVSTGKVKKEQEDDDDHKHEEMESVTKTSTSTVMVRGESEERKEEGHDDADFEKEFEECYAATEEMARMSISINNDEHFVVIEDANAKMFHNLSVNEDWLLV